MQMCQNESKVEPEKCFLVLTFLIVETVCLQMLLCGAEPGFLSTRCHVLASVP